MEAEVKSWRMAKVCDAGVQYTHLASDLRFSAYGNRNLNQRAKKGLITLT